MFFNDAAPPTYDTFGNPANRYRPGGLPSTVLYELPEDPCTSDHPSPQPVRFPPLRQFLPLSALAALHPSRFKGARRTFSSINFHHSWITLFTSCSVRSSILHTTLRHSGSRRIADSLKSPIR